MIRKGLRGRYSPMTDPKITDDAKEAVRALFARAESEGKFMAEVRYSTWIGHGCAADRGDITVVVDGAIYAMVKPDGTWY